MKNIEYRTFPLSEFRLTQSDSGTRFVGYAAVFDKLSDNLGGFKEKISRGAFRSSISQNNDVRALLNHDSNFVLGRTKSKTLELSEDKTGLRTEISPPDAQWAKDLAVSVNRGDIDQMSFGFRTIKDTWDKQNSDEPIRTLEDVELFDVSIVTFPAYKATSVDVALRSMEKWGESLDSNDNNDNDNNDDNGNDNNNNNDNDNDKNSNNENRNKPKPSGDNIDEELDNQDDTAADRARQAKRQSRELSLKIKQAV